MSVYCRPLAERLSYTARKPSARSHREEEWGTEKPLPESPNPHSPPQSNTCFHKVGCYEIKGHVMKGALRGFGDSVVL